MKINSLLETSAGATGSGSVASVASPIGGMKKRGGSMFTGKTTNKPFYEEKKDCGCPTECSCNKVDEAFDNTNPKEYLITVHHKTQDGEVGKAEYKITKANDTRHAKNIALLRHRKALEAKGIKYSTMHSSSQDVKMVDEGAMPQSVIRTKENIRMASDEENKKRFAGKTKEELASMARRHGYKDKNPYARFHDGKTGINEGSISNALVAVEEARLSEEDLILMPGQGVRFKKELMPKKTDHEVEMARGQLYQSAKNAKDICHMLEGISEMEGIDAWVQSKITTAADYLETVRAYMESKYEMQQEVDEATAREKFNKGLTKAGYDPYKGAARLLKLMAKQKAERIEHEKKYGHLYGELPKEKDEVKEVASKFNSKQEVIQYFVSKGKSAASGAAAWERGWRGSKAKKKELRSPVRSYHDDLDDKRYGEQSMEEATGDNPFDAMMKNIVKGAPKQATADRKEQRKQNQEKARDAFSNMFGGGNPADKLSIRKKNEDVSEARNGDTNFGSTVGHGSWVVYDGGKVKRFKSREGAKAYAEKNGGKVASSEFYADNIQGKQGVSEEKVRLDPKCWKGKHKEGTKMKGGVRVNNCVPNESIEEEKEGLWANIHAKRERIKHGSGERMRKPGSKGAPTADALKKSAKD